LWCSGQFQAQRKLGRFSFQGSVAPLNPRAASGFTDPNRTPGVKKASSFIEDIVGIVFA
jgi:hypothetical protein